ncbi:hypothetical protein V8E53_010328 [Lactarius tabidus]
MPQNGLCDSSSSFKSIPLGTLESGQSLCLGVSTPQPSDHSNHEAPSSDRSVDMDAMPPPLGVKLTGYRLVFMVTVLLFGTVKTILTYMGQSIAPTTLDWVAGTFLTAVLYWIDLYEGSNKCQWFFQLDYAPPIGYFAKSTVGGGPLAVVLLPQHTRVLVAGPFADPRGCKCTYPACFFCSYRDRECLRHCPHHGTSLARSGSI